MKEIPYLIEQDGHWHYFRRAPDHIHSLGTPRIIKVTTKIKVERDAHGHVTAKNRAAAKQASAAINNETEAYWRDLVEGRNAEARHNFRLAVKRAAQFGFAPLPYQEVLKADLRQVLDRGHALKRFGAEDPINQEALLGLTMQTASVLLSELVGQYMALPKVRFVDLKGKSLQQIKTWKLMRDSAVKRLIAIIGDKLSITVADANAFNDWYSGYIHDNGFKTEGARKDIDVLRKMIRLICEREKLKDPGVWGKNPFPASGGKRNAFSIAFVRDVLLKPGALDDMDALARDFLHVLIDTGARPSEIAALRAPTVRLTHNIPHIAIREDGRQVKSKNAVRDVPLIGYALEAMRQHPDGFPTLRESAAYDRLMREINKWLKKLLPADAKLEDGDDADKQGTSAYSLRHTFKDRLRAIRAEDEMKVALMGHDIGNVGKVPDYGNGYSLESKAEVMAQIDFSRAA